MTNKTSFGEYFDNQRDRMIKAMQNKNTELNVAWREDYDKRQKEMAQKKLVSQGSSEVLCTND